MPSARLFKDDEAGYVAWLQKHPDGYVLNAHRTPVASYLSLHKAGCHTISDLSRYGDDAYTGRRFVKVCGETVADLLDWIKAAGYKRFSGFCKACGSREAANTDVSTTKDKKSCEIWTGARWEIWPVAAVYPHRDTARIRCYECHGAIILMQQSQDGRNSAHFEHKPAHRNCSLVHWRSDAVLPATAPIVEVSSHESSSPDYISEEAVNVMIGEVDATEKERLVLARVGQGLFRKKLAARWRKCSVTSCGPQSVLIASHIVAWRNCETNAERLDVNNGLLLTPNLDKLFDRHLVSFMSDGRLVISRDLDEGDALALGLQPGMRLTQVPRGIVKYLDQHRANGEWVELRPQTPLHP